MLTYLLVVSALQRRSTGGPVKFRLLIPRVRTGNENQAGMTCMMSVRVRRYQGVQWGPGGSLLKIG